jgi:hypothetical protein
LSFGDTSPLSAGDPRSGMVIALPVGVDREGNVYSRSMMGGGPGGQLPDSGAVLRIVRSSMALDTVASFKLGDRIQSTSGGPNNQQQRIENIPLSPEDSWGLASDGSVVVARSEDYHIEWFGTDGVVLRGQPLAVDAVALGTDEKEEWVAGQGRSGGGLGIGVNINNGVMQMSFQRGGGGGGREIDQYQWPETKPPFYSGRLDVDAEDRVWVRRHVDAGEEATYDVFDRAGEYVATYTLANNKRLIGFGANSVYVVAYDEFDLNYLERYAMPAL